MLGKRSRFDVRLHQPEHVDSQTIPAQNARGDMEEIVTKVAKQGAVMNMVKEHRQKVMQKHQEIAKLCHVGGVRGVVDWLLLMLLLSRTAR